MSSFYGISPNQKPFVFDRIYGSYISALAAASAENGDGVYPGRYILIEYEHKDSGVNYENTPTIYEQNKSRDEDEENGVPTQRKNYDSTVWMKKPNSSNNINPTLEDFYINVAELNSPSISLKDIDFGYEIENGKTLKDLVYTGDTIPLDEITFSSLLTDGQLTQPLNIHIQSIGHIMNTAYNLLYGKNRNDIEYNAEDEDIDYNTNTKSMLGSINYVNKLLKEVKNSSYPGLGDNNDYLSVEDDGKLHHVNKSRGKNVIATFSVNNFSIGKTTNNVLEVNATSEDIQTDSLGHIIDITSSSTTNLIDLSIGAVPKSGNTETKKTTIWGNIGYTSSSDNTLWGKVSSINSSVTSITNIIGSSNTTTDTGTLWDNIHNINNIIGSSTITDPGTLWSNIDNITNNISSITAAIGTKPTGTLKTTIWSNIGSINSTVNTLWVKVSSIDSSVTSISNNIGSSSDPTNTTTVWSNINRIDSVIGTTTDTSDKNTLYGKIKKVNDDLHYQIFEYEFEEPQYISSYALSSEITGASFTDNNTLIKDGITITKIGKTITINNVTTTLYEDCYEIPRKYKIIKKQYDNGKLECYGQITNIYIAYGGYYKQTGDYYSDYKNQIVLAGSTSSNHYAIPKNTYVLDDPSKQEIIRGKLFIGTPDFIQLTAYGDNVGMWKDSEKLCTISKDNFFVTWYSAITSQHTSDQKTGSGQYLPCSAFRGKWCKPNANLSANTNSCNSLSFHVIGRWE